jgi:hypothetical protein
MHCASTSALRLSNSCARALISARTQSTARKLPFIVRDDAAPVPGRHCGGTLAGSVGERRSFAG